MSKSAVAALMGRGDDPGEQQRNMNRFTVTKAHVDQLMKEGETLEKETEDLARRVTSLGEKIVQEKASLEQIVISSPQS